MRVKCTEHSLHDMKTSYQTASSEAWEPPGGVLVWLLVFLEVITFGAGIITFLAQGRDHTAEFAAGRELLNQPLAFANTLLLFPHRQCRPNHTSLATMAYYTVLIVLFLFRLIQSA